MLHLTIAADRIDCWVRRHIVPCDAPSNVNGAHDRYVIAGETLHPLARLGSCRNQKRIHGRP